ncbi:MAG TPA: sterol desaturase family protein [Patescibacteria group bacterium]|nr:sterol desaturase family protein [Patescibacteria group bacterium]
MAKFVSNRDETIRLFKNPVLEYFSHIHPATPVVVFTPIIIYFQYLAFKEVGSAIAVVAFIAGVLVWSLTEYAIHRWAFHYEPKSAIGKKVHFLVHGIHHDYPRDSTRLVMPLLVSVPLAIAFYILYAAIFGEFHNAVFAGFMAGYVAYDSIHYATHHMKMTSSVGQFLKNYHLKHHYQDPHTAYGVSNPLWDYVFKTTPTHEIVRKPQAKTKKKELA